jgi:uncharacterized membrane protein
MNRVKIAAGGFAAGAALMYLYDPNRGKRRRAGVRDKTLKTYTDFACQLEKAGRDLSHRAQGVLAEARALAARPDPYVLAERVKTRIGRAVSHPHALQVHNDEGVIKLEGPVLANEVEALLRAVRSVPGVREVRDRLEVHEEAGNISSLQGGRVRNGNARDRWTPTARFAAGGLGGLLMLLGARRGGLAKVAGSLAGSGLITRAVANRDWRRLVGAGEDPHTVEFEKVIHIEAPVEAVFAFWSQYANFPRFMAHLKEVHDLGDGRSHWVAEGPGGVPVSWHAEITKNVPNETLAWRSLPGSQVKSEGVVRFEKDGRGGTRVTIRLSYSPPAGVFGHIVASIFGNDPKSEMDDDMVRLKSLLEYGKTRAHGQRVTREGVLQMSGA